MLKALASRLKETLLDLISCQQTAYVQNRFNGEGVRPISDILEMSNNFNLIWYIVIVDIEKVFDTLNHSFLLACLKKFAFRHDFLWWVKVLLESQKSCIINAGIATSYFNLQKGMHQGSAYLFISCLEVLFLLVKANDKIGDMNIFQYTYLYTVSGDDTTFFLKNKNSIRQLIDLFLTFTQYYCLKSSYEKCEIAVVGVLKSVKMTVYAISILVYFVTLFKQ